MLKKASSLNNLTGNKSQDDKNFASGASAAINRTITEIDNLINKSQSDGDVGALRGKLHKKIEKLNKKWFKYGCSHGYYEAYHRSKSGKKLSKKAKIKRKLRFGLDQKNQTEIEFDVIVF